MICVHYVVIIILDSAVDIQYSSDSKYLAIAGDRNVKVFHNITGFKAAIEESTMKLKEAKTESAKQRIQTVIDEYKYIIDASIIYSLYCIS